LCRFEGSANFLAYHAMSFGLSFATTPREFNQPKPDHFLCLKGECRKGEWIVHTSPLGRAKPASENKKGGRSRPGLLSSSP
jgi:hypothetical protein